MKATIVLFLFLAISSRIVAVDTLVINSEGDNYILGNYIEMLKDKEDKLSFSMVRNIGGWEGLSHVAHLNVPETNTTFWFRYNIRNMDTLNQSWLIEFPDGHNSYLQLFEVSDTGKVTVYKPVGLGQPISNRVVDHKNFIYELKIPQGKTYTYYVKVKSSYLSSFWASVRTAKFLISYIGKEYYFIGLFYGILFIMAMYNLLIFLFTKEIVYFMYVLYVISCGLYTFSEDLIGFHLFWPEVTIFNHFHFENAPSILVCAFTFYAIEFLDLKSRQKNFVYFLYVLVALNFISTAFISNYLHLQVRAILFLLPFATIYYQAIRLFFKKKYKPARFFLIGFSIILIGFLVFVLRTYGIITSTLYTIYIFNFGFVLEVMIFSYALGDKIRVIKDEKEKSQASLILMLEEKEVLKDKINKELEQKVQERTVALKGKSDELELANEKLKALTDELNKMNSQLDIDNWNLKKQVKEETKSRILIENVTYEEFLTIFPNDSICLQYLENLKWSEGFQCKKCHNTNFSKGEKDFSRKCTKCKYSESVTAGTLFHAIKFPLNKAFYITYDAFKAVSNYTIEELSEIIDLRKATVWTFRKKALDEKLAKLKTKKNLESWNDIIID